MMRSLVLATLLFSAAHAETQEEIVDHLINTGGPANDPLAITPRLVIGETAAVSPASYTTGMASPAADSRFAVLKKPLIVMTKDASWLVSDYALRDMCAKENCDKDPDRGSGHTIAVFDQGKPVAWIIAQTAKAKKLDALPRTVDAGTEDVVKLFEGSIGDPAQLAATLSDRAETTLLGSEKSEHVTGLAAVRKQLLAWKLAFTVKDGPVAGAAGKTLVYVAANVDALRKGSKKPTPYRMFAVYEKTTDWKLVALQFANR